MLTCANPGCGTSFAPRGVHHRFCSAVCKDRGSKVLLRMEAISAYGGVCACCREAEFAFLQLDHLEDGAAHRAEVRADWNQRASWQPGGNGAGCNTYAWLKRRGWPPIVQVLCANCNYAKQMGGCPHARPSLQAV